MFVCFSALMMAEVVCWNMAFYWCFSWL